MNDEDDLDMDSIILANFIEEWYPHVPYCVILKNQQSIKLVENSIFQNNNIDYTYLYSTAFMTGKVFYLTGSIFVDDPVHRKFLNDMIEDKSKLITLQVNSNYFANQKYGDIFHNLLYTSPIKLLLIGVYAFSNHICKPMENYLRDILDDAGGKFNTLALIDLSLFRDACPQPKQ